MPLGVFVFVPMMTGKQCWIRNNQSVWPHTVPTEKLNSLASGVLNLSDYTLEPEDRSLFIMKIENWLSNIFQA
jgi:hypothetical protein